MGIAVMRWPSRFLLYLLLALAAIARAQSPAPLALPDLSTLTMTGPGGAVSPSQVSMVGSDSLGGVYIGGPFTQVNGLTTPAVARLQSDGTLDGAWTSGLSGGSAGTVHVDRGGGVNIAVFDAGAWRVWRRAGTSLTPIYSALPDYAISAITSDPGGVIYVAEQAFSLAAGTANARVYRFAPDGTRDTTFNVTVGGQNPCETAAQSFAVQSRIHGLRFDGRRSLYIVGDFTAETVDLTGFPVAATIGGAFRIDLVAQRLDLFWRPVDPLPPAPPPAAAKTTCIPQATKIVHDAAIPGDGFVYLAGSFPGALRRFSESSGASDPGWQPATAVASASEIPLVKAIAIDVERHRIHAGGPVDDFNGSTQRLAALWLFPGAAQDTTWSPPQPNGSVDLVALGSDRLDVGGGFTLLGSTPRVHVAAFPRAGTSVIANYYQAILGRPVDPSGSAFWGNSAVSFAALGVSPNEAYMAMAMFFFGSAEFLATPLTDAQYVDKLYLTFFNRASDASGRDYWVGQIAAGLSREMVMFAFMFSPEFDQYMASNLGGAHPMRAEIGVVMDFYRGVLARLPDAAGLKYWVNLFRRAQCSADPLGNTYQTAIAISDAFFNGPEYGQSQPTHPQYVSDLYNAFMRRSADVAGFNLWVNQLQSGAITATAARRAFIDSSEFNARVQAIASAGCVAQMP